MRDHRTDPTPEEAAAGERLRRDVTDLVRTHHTRHPGSVKRVPQAKRRAAAKRARISRKRNRP